MTSSTRTEGAASAALPVVIPDGATLAEIDQLEQAAVDAIDSVETPDEAERLLREVTIAEQAIRIAKLSGEREQRWGGLRLRAERRYGELLRPAEMGRPTGKVSSTNLSGAEKVARNQARKVAAVPQDDFDTYIQQAEKPTRSGLLRNSEKRPPKPRARRTDTAPPDALEMLRRRAKQVRETDSRVRPRWTLEDVDHVELVTDNLLRRRPKYSGKRLRDLTAKRRTGSSTGLIDLQYRMMQLTSILESVDVADLDLADPEDAADFHQDLVELHLWMDRAIALASSRLDDAALARKLSKLRDPTGRTEAERATAAVLAEKLERRRRESRLAS